MKKKYLIPSTRIAGDNISSSVLATSGVETTPKDPPSSASDISKGGTSIDSKRRFSGGGVDDMDDFWSSSK